MAGEPGGREAAGLISKGRREVRATDERRACLERAMTQRDPSRILENIAHCDDPANDLRGKSLGTICWPILQGSDGMGYIQAWTAYMRDPGAEYDVIPLDDRQDTYWRARPECRRPGSP